MLVFAWSQFLTAVRRCRNLVLIGLTGSKNSMAFAANTDLRRCGVLFRPSRGMVARWARWDFIGAYIVAITASATAVVLSLPSSPFLQ